MIRSWVRPLAFVPTLFLGMEAVAQSPPNPVSIALDHLRSDSSKRRAFASDDTTLEARDLNTTQQSGVTAVHVRQRLAGIEIHGAEVSVVVGRDGKVLRQHGEATSWTLEEAPSPTPGLSARDAILRAAAHLGLGNTGPLEELASPKGVERATRFTQAGLSRDEILARLNYVPGEKAELQLAWNVILRPPDGHHWWNLFVDAENGEILAQYDWVRHDRYRVFDDPLENPDQGERTLVIDPADPTASPYGWHDTNGVAGSESTETRGNNAEAQEDSDGDNVVGNRPSGGAELIFDFPLDLSAQPSTIRDASTVQLFYTTNRAHDIFYAYGFTEASGNFQENNYGRGGVGGDPVVADCQDGFGTNNALFLAPPDGFKPRMEMFLFDAGSTTNVVVNSPPELAIALYAAGAAFGPTAVSPGLQGDLVRGLDAADAAGPSIYDGCSALQNPSEVAGKIALIDRGVCVFVEKVINAQNAGAVGVLIANNAGDSVITMGGTDPSIAIPSLFIGQSNGQELASALGSGWTVNVTLNASVPRDAAFDSGIVVHEYGHGVTSRLTGGASNANCLFSEHGAGMAEGWSDFFSLVVTAKPGDQGSDSRSIGNYVLEQPAAGAGIRSHPYDTDFSENDLTFVDIATQSRPHGVGVVWATALWEIYWNFVDAYGFQSDLISGTGGNHRSLQVVIDALKLQACEPTFLEARDAILLAETQAGGTHECLIWKGFAKRGMGFAASDGGDEDSLSVTEDFSLPAQCAEYCGDGVVQSGESCEDGNLLPLDGCSAACRDEITVPFTGTASGGTVDLILSGESISLVTVSGQSAETVATNLETVVTSNASLSALGINATAVGSDWVTDGTVDALEINDDGLAPQLPGLTPAGVVVFALWTAVVGARRLRSGRTPSG